MHALRIYDSMVLDDVEGRRLIQRPKDWDREERRINKRVRSILVLQRVAIQPLS